jgi:hypothetical protein
MADSCFSSPNFTGKQKVLEILEDSSDEMSYEQIVDKLREVEPQSIRLALPRAMMRLLWRRVSGLGAWVFRYPSGLPYTLSSALFRRYLAAIYQKYPNTPKAVLIGHSMGGLVADMMIRDSAGNQYCDDVLGKPLDQFQIEPDQPTEGQDWGER